jgi:hypothetical protein
MRETKATLRWEKQKEYSSRQAERDEGQKKKNK